MSSQEVISKLPRVGKVSTAAPALIPAQQSAYQDLVEAARPGSVTYLVGDVGIGKTTLLRRLQEELGGALITSEDLLKAIAGGHPQAIDESVFGLLDGALRHNQTVLVDDIDIITYANSAELSYPRAHLFGLAFTALAETARSSNRRLVFALDSQYEDRLAKRMIGRAQTVTFPHLGVTDYSAVLSGALGDLPTDFRVEKIFTSSSRLSIYQLLSTCEYLRDQLDLSTEGFLEVLQTKILTSNVELFEVADVKFSDLKGLDAVVESLEINVVLPMENLERFSDLDLRPKRGVLLYGPPGTGKTSIGRALAHRLRGKFFMIDGTFITEPPALFFNRIREVFSNAKQNSPSVIFIDDADVLFRTDHVYGLNRFLLTQLDGLESETAGNVTVMMTAMQIGHLPVALLRSGRVELWLETKLPDAEARRAILAKHIAGLPAEMRTYDLEELDEITKGFNGADMKRLVEDTKALFAYDTNTGKNPSAIMFYLKTSAEIVRKNKQSLARAERIIAGKESEYPMDECGW